MKQIIVFTFILLSFVNKSLACKVENLTGQENISARQKLFTNMDNPGVRLSFSGMKEANKKYGLGGVNDAISRYEKRLCERFNKKSGIDVNVRKTDFKGYYITCSPMPGCLKVVDDGLRQMVFAKFSDGAEMATQRAQALNYQEGYIKARALSQYPNFKPPLEKFIKDELSRGIVEATGNKSLKNVTINDPNFSQKLAENIEKYRKGGVSEVDDNFRTLVIGLDNLLEIPFTSSNNIESELEDALTSLGEKNAGRYKVTTAQTGDDLFVVIKEGDQVRKVVGADARGLGVTNMTTRYNEMLKHLQSGRDFSSMSDVFDLSKRAIDSADELMEKSLKTYERFIVEELKLSPDLSLDQIVKAAHEKYTALAESDSSLMQVRAGALNNCGTNKASIMNRITAIHNRLKTMEEAGFDGFFGASCLGTEYWLLKRGLK